MTELVNDFVNGLLEVVRFFIVGVGLAAAVMVVVIPLAAGGAFIIADAEVKRKEAAKATYLKSRREFLNNNPELVARWKSDAQSPAKRARRVLGYSKSAFALQFGEDRSASMAATHGLEPGKAELRRWSRLSQGGEK